MMRNRRGNSGVNMDDVDDDDDGLTENDDNDDDDDANDDDEVNDVARDDSDEVKASASSFVKRSNKSGSSRIVQIAAENSII